MYNTSNKIAAVCLFVFIFLTGVLSRPVLSEEEQHKIQETKADTGMSAEKEAREREDVFVYVDAQVVEVNAPALYATGVEPIVQSREERAAIANLVECIQQGTAHIVSRVDVSITGQREAKGERRMTRVTERPRSRVSHYAYMLSFSARVEKIVSTAVFLTFHYKQEASLSSGQIEVDWVGNLILEPGVPAIAGRIQQGEKICFLVISATMKNG